MSAMPVFDSPGMFEDQPLLWVGLRTCTQVSYLQGLSLQSCTPFAVFTLMELTCMVTSEALVESLQMHSTTALSSAAKVSLHDLDPLLSHTTTKVSDLKQIWTVQT